MPVTPVEIEVAGFAEAAKHEAAWNNLVDRALESNPFQEPAFALSAGRHLNDVEQPFFVFLWRAGVDRTAQDALLGVVTLTAPSFGGLVVGSWSHHHVVLGTPLLDAEHATMLLQTLLKWLSESAPHVAVLKFRHVAEDGAFAKSLCTLTPHLGLSIIRNEVHQRAVLRAQSKPLLSSKRRKELARLRRRLDICGDLQFVSARSVADVREACESYLTIEAQGWKGKKGSAFLQSPGEAAFLRAATLGMASRGKCRIDTLQLNGSAIAAGIMLGNSQHALYWKTTYSEDFAAFSPGLLLTADMTEQQIKERVMLTDSCAVEGHPMIERVWTDKMTVADWLVTLKPNNAIAPRIAVAAEQLLSSARSQVKRLLAYF